MDVVPLISLTAFAASNPDAKPHSDLPKRNLPKQAAKRAKLPAKLETGSHAKQPDEVALEIASLNSEMSRLTDQVGVLLRRTQADGNALPNDSKYTVHEADAVRDMDKPRAPTPKAAWNQTQSVPGSPSAGNVTGS